jgi:hypothetical protein
MSYTYPFDEFLEIWETEPLVITDTNGLFHIYRFSPETTEHILMALNRISDKIWIPAQVLIEYNANRESVISREYNKYKEVSTEVERIMQIAKNDISKQFIRFSKFRFPKVKELGEKINDSIQNIRKESQKFEQEIKLEVKKNRRMLEEDKVQLFVKELISKRNVGSPFSISELLQIFDEGERRYKYKIPPGYMDEGKDKNDQTKRKKFGDLILWKEILNKSRSTQKPVIFITNDEKEDWWVLEDKGKVPVRPRDELLLEFKEYSNQPFAMMNLTNFINHISIINNMVDHSTHLEMNALSISTELIEYKEWEILLNDTQELTSYLIHSGDLQEYLSNPLSDVEVVELYQPELNIDSVDIDGNQVIIEGSFENQVAVNITESYSKNYSNEYSALILISGSISFEFEVNYEKIEDFIMMETLDIVIGGFEVLECSGYEEDIDEDEQRCIHCGNPAAYFTKGDQSVCEGCSIKYETCPDCGRLFEQGTLGSGFCRNCEGQH